MGSYAYVAIGSALGGVARFTLGGWLQRRLDASMPTFAGVALGRVLLPAHG